MERWLSDPEAPWWAKLRRAGLHIKEVQQRAAELRSGEAWSIQREEANATGWAYRFKVHQPIPADLAAAVGDAVANMRAALDYVAYELARHHLAGMGRKMGDKEEAATAFPIRIDDAAFERFFAEGKQISVEGEKVSIRSGLYGAVERKALRCVQPFALTEEAREVGVERPTDPRIDLLTNNAYVLNAIWNIDKHRRPPELAWAIDDLVSWSSQPDVAYRWVRRVEKLSPLRDDTLLGELHASGGRPQAYLDFGVHLVLNDDPSPYHTPLVRLLDRLHQSLERWVLPRIFIVADGKPPPIMISFSAPA
jgi:hypothetical protein